MQVGLLFGSFNPVHQGHLILGQFMLQFHNLDEVWYVLSPQNPLKQASEMAGTAHRLAMLKLALDGCKRMKVCDIELSMPVPSYTIDTLTLLKRAYPGTDFSVIMGTDNMASIEKWKNYEKILDNFRILVYPRKDYILTDSPHHNAIFTNAPLVEISSTNIRRWISEGKDVEFFTPDTVCEYITKHRLYIQP